MCFDRVVLGFRLISNTEYIDMSGGTDGKINRKTREKFARRRVDVWRGLIWNLDCSEEM